MTLPLTTPTAKPPADLQPTAPLQPAVSLPPPPVDPISAVVAPAILSAINKAGAEAYFEMLMRTDPRLFHKWASLMVVRGGSGDSRQQNVINIVSAIPRSTLDELPPGFQING